MASLVKVDLIKNVDGSVVYHVNINWLKGNLIFDRCTWTPVGVLMRRDNSRAIRTRLGQNSTRVSSTQARLEMLMSRVEQLVTRLEKLARNSKIFCI